MLSSFQQLALNEVRAENLDLLVVASGYEERATFVAQHLGRGPSHRLCLGFAEQLEHPRRAKNDRIFAQLGYSKVQCSGDDWKTAAEEVSRRLVQGGGNLRIGIDISSMTRAWYWGI